VLYQRLFNQSITFYKLNYNRIVRQLVGKPPLTWSSVSEVSVAVVVDLVVFDSVVPALPAETSDRNKKLITRREYPNAT